MANFTIEHADVSALTIYAFPSDKSLADWVTYRILLTEQGAPNLGKYLGTINSDNGRTWLIYYGATQPNYNDFIATWSVPKLSIGDTFRWNHIDKGAGYDEVRITETP